MAVAEQKRLSRAVHWTVDEYYKMGKAGLFDDKRVELIAGEISEMPPIGPDHWVGTNKTTAVFQRLFGEKFLVSNQNPLRLSDDSEPEPDLALIEGDWDDFTDVLPATAVLVVEVSSSTLADDRTIKASLYAHAGIPEYWIINLIDKQLEVHRAPQPQTNQPFGFGYGEVKIYKSDEAVAPMAAPETLVKVEDLLP